MHPASAREMPCGAVAAVRGSLVVGCRAGG